MHSYNSSMLLLFVILFTSAACEEITSCNGDNNATHLDCPIACPSTCAKPNAEFCNQQCAKPGCACKPGYILTETNGKCIKPEDCPGGKVCGPNENFQYCAVKCPNNYCPVNEFIVACSPPRPCPSGCGCTGGYVRRSTNNETCIPSTECPPVKCSRPNEVWNQRVGSCYSDSCSDRCTMTSPSCTAPATDYYRSRCVCKPGYFRAADNECVPEECCPVTE